MKALVTGGSGYFGSLLIDKLIENGWEVGSLDINEVSDLPMNVSFHEQDIRDAKGLKKCLIGYDVVFHNIAQVPLAKDRKLFWNVNVEGTRNLFEAAIEIGLNKIVYTSSSAVFGVPDKNPVTENTIPKPREAYGRAKLEGERISAKYADQELTVTIIRPRTILGHGRLGIFQILFEWISKGINIPVLNGGENIYQFVHASDLAFATISASGLSKSGTYNIGTDIYGSMRESLEALCEHADTGSRVYSLPMKPIQMLMNITSVLGLSPLGPYHSLMYGRSIYFDISKAKNELGFKPRYSNIEMLVESYDWYIRNRDIILGGNKNMSHHRSRLDEGVLKYLNGFHKFSNNLHS